MHNFIISCCDTDSVTFSKPDFSTFTTEEVDKLLNEINGLMPKYIKLDLEEVYKKIIVFRAKNYVLLSNNGKIKFKGSAVKAPAKEQAIRDFVIQTIDAILQEKTNFTEIYTKFVLEIIQPTIDIKRFSTRKTLTAKTYESERANESKIIAAIENTEYVEGNRIWVYFTQEGTLKLAEHYKGDHDPQVLLKKLYMTSKLFDTVLPTKELYLNYSLKRNQKLLETLGNPTCKENLQVPEFTLVQESLPKVVESAVNQTVDCPGWREIKAKYPELFNKVYNLPNLLPPKEKTFRAFKYFKPKDCKVVILAQDPYPSKDDACGLAFSVERKTVPPASLRNIAKELFSDTGIDIESGNLEPWAKQGVLLLNSILSTVEGESAAHKNLGWETYTTNKIQQIIDCKQPLVLLVWGKYAQDKLQNLVLHDKLLVIAGAHPSPLAGGKFFGGRYFSRTNEFLEKHGITPIDWSL